MVMGCGIIASQALLHLFNFQVFIDFIIPIFLFHITVYMLFQAHKYTHNTHINLLYHKSKSN